MMSHSPLKRWFKPLILILLATALSAGCKKDAPEPEAQKQEDFSALTWMQLLDRIESGVERDAKFEDCNDDHSSCLNKHKRRVKELTTLVILYDASLQKVVTIADRNTLMQGKKEIQERIEESRSHISSVEDAIRQKQKEKKYKIERRRSALTDLASLQKKYKCNFNALECELPTDTRELESLNEDLKDLNLSLRYNYLQAEDFNINSQESPDFNLSPLISKVEATIESLYSQEQANTQQLIDELKSQLKAQGINVFISPYSWHLLGWNFFIEGTQEVNTVVTFLKANWEAIQEIPTIKRNGGIKSLSQSRFPHYNSERNSLSVGPNYCDLQMLSQVLSLEEEFNHLVKASEFYVGLKYYSNESIVVDVSQYEAPNLAIADLQRLIDIWSSDLGPLISRYLKHFKQEKAHVRVNIDKSSISGRTDSTLTHEYRESSDGSDVWDLELKLRVPTERALDFSIVISQIEAKVKKLEEAK